MSRMIDADALKKEILETYEYEYPTASGAFDEFVSRIVPNIISNAPTIDVETAVHGRWDDSQSEIIGGLYHKVRECSECGWTYDMVIEFNYCPNCGARMDGDSNDQ